MQKALRTAKQIFKGGQMTKIIDSEQKDPQTGKHEIAQSRADMDCPVGALEKKMSPGNLLAQAMSYFRAPGGKAECASRLAKNNLPIALAGLGVAWLLLTANSAGNGDVNAPHDQEDAADEYVGSRSTTKAGGDSLKSGDATIAALKHELTVIAQEQPFLLVASGVALGAAIGAVLRARDRA
jgi:hypothetical protein